jgi:xanthine dehydrogenase accessory factor
MKEIFQTVVQALRNEHPIALVTVVRSIGSTPRHAAAKMAVRADGSCVGTIGGGSMEYQAIQDALAAIAEGESRLIQYSLIGRTPQSLGLCGGTQEVFIDVINGHSKNGRTGQTGDFFEAIVTACDRGEPAALITVVHSQNGRGRQVGEKALLCYDMSAHGELEPEVLVAAQQVLEQNRSTRLGYRSEEHTCTPLDSFSREGVEFFVDVIQPRPELMIIGAGHIGLALAELGRIMGMRVIVVDDRSEWIDRFPEADETIVVSYDPETEALAAMPVIITPSTYIVVATWGWDEPALAQVVTSSAPYVSLVASRRKAKLIFEVLVERGIPRDDLARVRVPAGLDLGAETPEEVALSIMAEILLLQRGATGRPMTEVRGHPLALRSGRSRKQVLTT